MTAKHDKATEKMLEKHLQDAIVKKLDPKTSVWRSIPIANHTTSSTTLGSLIGDFDFKIDERPTLHRKGTALSVDLFGSMKPDIMIRSSESKQNRIIIEVKKTALCTHKERHASQILRYFLHLLATTDQQPNKKSDIHRAVLVAAPTSWFNSKSHSRCWNEFLEHYSPLAKTFNIALGEIRTDGIAST